MAVIIRRTLLTLVVLVSALGLVHCGGSSSSRSSVETMPIDVSLQDVQLLAGQPTTITYTIPAADRPYTEITIDLNRTLRAANVAVTPTP